MLEWRNWRKMVQVERRINQITAILPLSSELPAVAVDAATGASWRVRWSGQRRSARKLTQSDAASKVAG